MAEETTTAQTPEIDPGMAVVPEGPGVMDVPTIIPELEHAASVLATDVSFAKKTWRDGEVGATPITAAELNRLEQGVSDLTAAVNALRDSVSQSPLAGVKRFMMNTGKTKVTFHSDGGHRCFLAFSSGNSSPWLVLYAHNTVSGGFQKLGNVSVEKNGDDECTITAVQWSHVMIIPLSGTIEIADV